jgi:hypothetical protein
MPGKKSSRTFFRSEFLLACACAASLWSALAVAQDENGLAGRRGRFAITAGFDLWDNLNELRPIEPGNFDSGGLLIDFAAHWRMKQSGSRELLFGFDVGVFSNDSDVFHRRDELITRGMYVTPSVKWQLAPSNGRRYSLDFGAGYYLVDIAEVDTSGYYGYYCCYSFAEEQLWEDSSFGGFIGITIDFGRAARREGGGFTMSARIHWLDLGMVRDERRFGGIDTLGTNAGRLEGPIYAIQFGYAF